MLDPTQLTGFVVASVIVILVPGVDVFLLLRLSIHAGVRAGLVALLGIHLGNAVQAIVMVSGLGLLIAKVPAALVVLKILGALYLLYLAFMILRSIVGGDSGQPDGTQPGNSGGRQTSPFVLGFLTNVTNPKVLIFFLAFFPQFVGNAQNVPLQLALLSTVFIVLAVAWELLIVLAAAKLGKTLSSPRFLKVMDGICVVVFIALAIMVLVT